MLSIEGGGINTVVVGGTGVGPVDPKNVMEIINSLCKEFDL